MFGFLETAIREQQKFKKGLQASVDNTVNVEIVWKTKITFLLSRTFLSFLKQKYILFLVTYFFKILIKHLIALVFFFAEADTKKHRYVLAKAFAFANCQGKFRMLLFTWKTLWFEISLQSNWPKWNLHQSEFHFTWSHVNAGNEVTLHQGENSPQSEISNWFEFTSGSCKVLLELDPK